MDDPTSPPGPDRSLAGDPDGPAHRDYPVVLDLDGWECLVVGGGPVGARRAAGLLAAGGRVTVVAPEMTEPLVARAGRAAPPATGPAIRLERRPYRPGEAAGYRFVVTATGRPEVDATVVADALAAGVLVNSAAGAVSGTVRLPAVHRQGPVTLAVSTGTTSPALAAWLRTRLATFLPSGLATVADLLGQGRPARGQPGRNREDWAALVEQVVSLVEAGRIDEARQVMRSTSPPG